MMNLSRLGLGFGRGRPMAPSLPLYFGGHLDSRITFSRASEGSYVDSAGVMSWFAGDEPRTGDRGLLVEGARTNLLKYSEALDDDVWMKNGATVSADATTAPDGSLTADKLVEDTSTGPHTVVQNVSVTSGADYTGSCVLQAGERTQAFLQLGPSGAFGEVNPRVFVDLVAGTVVTTAGGATGTIRPIGDGYRVSITGTSATTGGGQFTVGITTNAAGGATTYTGDGTSGLYIWGAQLKAGAFPTSYIRTTSAAATRAADVATIDLEGAAWFNPNEGTIYAEFLIPHPAPSGLFHSIISFFKDGANRITLTVSAVDSMVRMTTRVGDVGSGSAVSGPYTYGTWCRVAGAWKADDVAICLNGGAVAVDTTAEIPTGLTDAVIGQLVVGNNPLNGFIRRLTYWPRRLSDEELVGKTS